MGNRLSMQKGRKEKNRIREQINDLSVMLHALQEEMTSKKTKSEEKVIEIVDTAKENRREIRTCSEKLSVVKDKMGNNFEKLEKEMKIHNERMERLRIDFEEDKKSVYQLLDRQANNRKELEKALRSLQERTASFDDFAALSISFEKFKNRIDVERDEIPTCVRKFLKERLSELEKEILDMAEKFQETRGFMMELITLDLGHERDIVGLKYRVDKLEECATRLSGKTDDILPTPSLPEIARVLSVTSEAPSISNQESKTDTGEIDNYELKMSKISTVMKRMKTELQKP